MSPNTCGTPGGKVPQEAANSLYHALPPPYTHSIARQRQTPGSNYRNLNVPNSKTNHRSLANLSQLELIVLFLIVWGTFIVGFTIIHGLAYITTTIFISGILTILLVCLVVLEMREEEVE